MEVNRILCATTHEHESPHHQQFLSDHTNRRTDEYGGPIENRYRLLKEIVEAVIDVFGPSRVVRASCVYGWVYRSLPPLMTIHQNPNQSQGVRLSPASTFNDICFTDRHTDFAHVIRQLNQYDLAYLHIVEPRVEGSKDKEEGTDGDGSAIDWSLGTPRWRQLWRGPLIGAGGYTRRGAEAALHRGDVDLVAFGRWFISNPDLPVRFGLAFRAEEKEGRGGDVGGKGDVDKKFLIPYDRSTFYGGDARGYTDYPTLAEQEENEAKEGVGGGEGLLS